MPVLLTHPTGNQFFKAAAAGFYEAGELGAVYTSLASFHGSLLYRLGSFKILADIQRRSLNSAFEKITHTHPLREMGRLLAIKAGKKKLLEHETGVFSVDKVYKSLDKYVAKNLVREQRRGVSAIYAYEDGAYYSFKKGRALNLKCFYDLPIGYWRAMHVILAKEKEFNPEWAVTLDGLKDSSEKLNRKDEELRLSDKIFVASSFTAKTLEAYPHKLPQVYIVPYGFPAVRPKHYRAITSSEKIKLLFVGGLSQRKGLSYLFKAMEGFESHFTLTVVGRLSSKECKPLNTELKKYNYIPSVPHEKILQLMQGHDILVFPSLFEGFGQVITEAMAQGTPVITTERTAGADLIKHGENGWLVNAGSVEAIKNILEQVIVKPGMIAEVGKQALETAKKRPWKVYGEELAKAVMTIDNGELTMDS